MYPRRNLVCSGVAQGDCPIELDMGVERKKLEWQRQQGERREETGAAVTTGREKGPVGVAGTFAGTNRMDHKHVTDLLG